jgi:uncharacterized protein (TIGR02145 family)
MKIISSIILAVVFTAQIIGQAPNSFKYQTVIRDAVGNPKASTTVVLKISILQGDINGTVVYSDVFNVLTNTNGIGNLEIGAGPNNASNLAFASIDWSAGPYFVQIAENETILATSQLLSVPYALYAAKAGNAGEGGTTNYKELSNTPNIKDTVLTYAMGKSISVKDTIDKYALAKATNIKDTVLKYAMVNSTNIKDSVLKYALINPVNIKDSVVKYAFVNAPDPVNDKDVVTKEYVEILKERITALENVVGPLPVFDVDFNKYETVIIGSQTWMASNLRTTKFKDGTPITQELLYGGWADTSIVDKRSKYSWYGGSVSSLQVTDSMGYLYNYPAIINTKGLCPKGFHVSTDEDWNTLDAFLATNQGGQIKALTSWASPNTGATDELNFGALPGGFKQYGGEYIALYYYGSFWTPSATAPNGISVSRDLVYNLGSIVRNVGKDKRVGFSVRCVRD